MEKGNCKVFGQDIDSMNPHWLKVNSDVLLLLSKIDMATTLELIQYSGDEDNSDFEDSLAVVNSGLKSHGIHFEGYTLRVFAEWFIPYCKDFHEKHKAIQIKAKQDKIKRLEAELKELKK